MATDMCFKGQKRIRARVLSCNKRGCQCSVVASQDEGIPTDCLLTNTDSSIQRALNGGRTKQVEPSITLSTGGAQDLYSALGWQRFLLNVQVASTCKTWRRTPSVPRHSEMQCFHCTHQPPHSTIVVALTSCGCSLSTDRGDS